MSYHKMQELTDFARRTHNIVLERRMNCLMLKRHEMFCAQRKDRATNKEGK